MRTLLSHFTTLIFLGIFVLGTSVAFGQDAKSAQFGFVTGLSVPDLNNTNPAQMTGVKGAAYLAPAWSIGGYYLVSGSETQGGGIPFEYSLAGLEISYHIPGTAGDTFVALRYGVTKVTTEQAATELIFSPYHSGIAAGHDYYFTSLFSVGFEGSLLRVENARTTSGAASYTQDSYNYISFMLNLQVRL